MMDTGVVVPRRAGANGIQRLQSGDFLWLAIWACLASPRMHFSSSLLVLSVIDVLIAYAVKSAASGLMVSFVSLV